MHRPAWHQLPGKQSPHRTSAVNLRLAADDLPIFPIPRAAGACMSLGHHRDGRCCACLAASTMWPVHTCASCHLALGIPTHLTRHISCTTSTHLMAHPDAGTESHTRDATDIHSTAHTAIKMLLPYVSCLTLSAAHSTSPLVPGRGSITSAPVDRSLGK